MTAIPSQRMLVDNSFDTLKSKNIVTDCAGHVYAPLDIVDNPVFSKTDVADRNIFHQMRSEHNRLYSYQNTWPLKEVLPKHLANAGFFYLQQEDQVQCPFCEVKISDWIHKDNPLREHMRRSPMCPYLRGCDVGNVSLGPGKSESEHLNSTMARKHLPQDLSVSYKPKHPRMADIRRRILTFSNWQLNQPSPQQLSECGLYYSGVADVVTCFFCGGALGNWEPDDDPWTEHTKFFPDCAFLGIAKSKNSHQHHSTKVSGACRQESLEQKQAPSNGMPLMDSMSDIIEQAQAIFPDRLVSEVVKRKNGMLFSLQELCDDILELKQSQSTKTSQVIHNDSENKAISNNSDLKQIPEDTEFKVNGSSSNNDVLICKVCMDRERSAVFQPCGHLVACWICANLVSNCPLCRRPVTHKIRTYIS